jgi:hypothetical protein
MRNSLVFFKRNNSKSYTNMGYDCCEHLGTGFRDNNSATNMFVGIPLKEMDEFFLINEMKNLISYLGFVTQVFNIDYSLAVPEDVELVNMDGTGYEKKDVVFIMIHTEKNKTNKHFVAAYNVFRYLWYKMYTPMAIIATNLYNMGLITDPMDILAIASSYQQKGDRALLPSQTDNLEGLLFFRPKEDVLRELHNNTLFNSIFYKYPIYFDPTVQIRGQFFEECNTVIKAKELFGKLMGIQDIEDIPSSILRNFKLIYSDYLEMKDVYLNIKTTLDNGKYALNSRILLSRKMKALSINVMTSVGGNKTISFEMPWEKKSPVEEAIDKIMTEKPSKRKTIHEGIELPF